ncbi:MAG: LysM peptidoglycan-binding domain-containing protein [Opitutales bacterium]|nr:LysM peptidoglycan-binding domain-containing protein [Opitutales bacterium]
MLPSLAFRKISPKSVLIGACLFLQGCSLDFWNWNKKTASEPTIASTTTVIGDGTLAQQDAGIQRTEPSIRAVPRRPEPKEEPVEENEVPESTSLYVVCKGDTLTKIARRFHVSVFQLMQENHLRNKNKLRVGQILSIPQGDDASSSDVPPVVEPEPMKGERYRVQKGDTLTRIARRFRVSVEQLQQANSLANKNKLFVEQTLIIPQNGSCKGSFSAKDSSSGKGTYCVQKGDTLTRIAARCGTTVANLREWNHLTRDTIYVGQTLVVSETGISPKKPSTVPSPQKIISGDTYQVQSGDTLWGIAKRCHVSVSELKRCNPQMDPDRLQIGQVLSICKSSSSPVAAASRSLEQTADPFGSEPSQAVEIKEKPKEDEESEFKEFKDLFEENKDMPIPMNEKHE